KGDLRAREPLAGGHVPEQIDQRLVRPAGFGGKAWEGVTEIVLVEARALIDGPGQKASAQRAERHEGDAELLQRGQYFRLGLAPPQRVFALHGRNRLNLMGAPDGLSPGL